MRHRIGNLTVACVLACASGAAFAQFYVGSQVGYADGGPDAGQINNDLVNNLGFFSASTNVDKGDGAWRVFAGYQILPWLAVEGAYVDVGKTKWSSVVEPPGTLDVSLRTTAWTLGVAARYEFVPKWWGYGRMSAAWTETKSSVSASGFAEAAGEPKARRTVPCLRCRRRVRVLAARVRAARVRRHERRVERRAGRQVQHQHDQHRRSLSILDVRNRAARR